MNIFLQIFLGLNFCAIGALVTLAVQHGIAHYHTKANPNTNKADKAGKADHSTFDTAGDQEAASPLPQSMRDKLLKESQSNFQTVLDQSADGLHHDLQATNQQLNRLLQRLGTEIVGNEMERYRLDLEAIRKEAEKAVESAQMNIEEHQSDLKTKLAEEIRVEKEAMVQKLLAEKQRIVQQLDTKIADAVASFLVETLQHNVDLGAQTAYLTAQLEEHKAELIREVAGDAHVKD
jgi:hypothetical protein